MYHDKIIAAIRTYCSVAGPALITAVVTWLASRNVDIAIDESWGIAIAGLLFALVVAGYNFIANWLAVHVHPVIGTILLGVNKTPTYTETPYKGEHVREVPEPDADKP